MSLLDHVGLIEHGTWIGYVWLTDKGRWYQRALAEVDSWDELEESGFPHDDRECSDACWTLPVA
ncbi:hypothetical protein ACIQVR_39620 [Streptomyces xanthochromogenes]|uniref:hypothetical protein n=1 Tax=Streptomyces xanthochromogenes TaxID=67384 RepID=UPI0037FFAC01